MSGIKFPLDFKKGLGYAPNSGPPVGGWPGLVGKGFYGQSLDSVLPAPTRSFGTNRRIMRVSKYDNKIKLYRSINSKREFKNGSKKKSRSEMKNNFGRASFYPLSNGPSSTLNMKTYPLYPTGPGKTSGGSGGVFLQGMPTFDQYWAFGKSRKERKSKKRKDSKKSSKRKHRNRSKKRKHRKYSH